MRTATFSSLLFGISLEPKSQRLIALRPENAAYALNLWNNSLARPNNPW
jgi:hypothetical protein